MKETNKARKAFEDYFGMGPGRSIRKLHHSYIEGPSKSIPTKHLRTILEWSTKHGWQKRVQQRDLEIAEAALEGIKEIATRSGYAVFQKRVYDLGKLAERMFKLLETGALQPQVIREFRGLLGDIAAEMGERTQKIEFMDWREELRKVGGEPAKIFEEMVQHFVEAQSDSSD